MQCLPSFLLILLFPFSSLYYLRSFFFLFHRVEREAFLPSSSPFRKSHLSSFAAVQSRFSLPYVLLFFYFSRPPLVRSPFPLFGNRKFSSQSSFLFVSVSRTSLDDLEPLLPFEREPPGHLLRGIFFPLSFLLTGGLFFFSFF